MTSTAVKLALFSVLAFGVGTSAFAESQEYSGDAIRAKSVAGLRLGMTADEADRALKDGGFEGSFKKYSDTETTASSWVKVDQRVTPFRFRAADGQVRIWTIMFEQRFDRPQSVDALVGMVTDKYGAATERQAVTPVPTVKLTYHAHFTVDHQLSIISCQTGPGGFCPTKQYEAFEREQQFPIMEISVTPISIRARITDGEARLSGDKATQAAADAAREAKAASHTANTKLGL